MEGRDNGKIGEEGNIAQKRRRGKESDGKERVL